MHVESCLVWYGEICSQLVFSSHWRKVVCVSRMNPVVKQYVISEIFHEVFRELSKVSFICKRCFTKEIYCGVSNEREMLIHIYHKHRGFWNSSIFLPNSISELVWVKLFDWDGQSNAKCRHCGVVFYNVGERVLHHHIKMKHSIILLAFSLSENFN